MKSLNQTCQVLKHLMHDEKFISCFENSYDDDTYIHAKKQEQCLIDYSDEYFKRLLPLSEKYSQLYDSELDRKFGDFIDDYGNYFDLKTGTGGVNNYCGAINRDSLKDFGNTSSDRHWYLCSNDDFSKIYVINARKLFYEAKIKKLKFRKGKADYFLGELDYKNSNAVEIILKK